MIEAINHMTDPVEIALKWGDEGREVALATVIATWGSSPLPVGSQLVSDETGAFEGSVSGGCIEGAVITEAMDVIRDGQSKRLFFGVSNEQAWEVGLACGGSIEVFVQRFSPVLLGPITEGHTYRRTLIEAIVIEGPESQVGITGIFDVDGPVAGDWSGDLLAGTAAIINETVEDRTPKRVKNEVGGESVELFLDVFLPSETLIMIGGVHISIALSEMAKLLGYRTIVIDPRTAYPVENSVVSVSVTAGNCTLADGLATALMVMGHPKGLKLVERLEGVECLIVVQKPDGSLIDHASSGFPPDIFHKKSP